MIGIIINPNSSKNRNRPNRRKQFQKIVGRHGRVIETPSVDAIVPALKIFADEGRRYWVADGGDGGFHWMFNEAVRYFGADKACEMAVYLVTGGGNIDFLANSLGLRGSPLDVVQRLAALVERGGAPRIESVRSLWLTGKQIAYGGETVDFRKIGFGNSLAGYGANLFEPLYSTPNRGAVRIASLMASAFMAAAGRAVFTGRLSGFKPAFVGNAERTFLRPLPADVEIDGVLLRGEDGLPVTLHTALNVASVPLNLAGILRVFPKADGEHMHIHAGNVSAWEMARAFPGLMTAKDVSALIPNAYDGVARKLVVRCHPGCQMTPVIDGELFHRVTDLSVTLGPRVRMATP